MKDCRFKLPVKVFKSSPLVLRDAQNRQICDANSSSFDFEEDAAHLAHIARCVNLHEELVKALETCQDRAESTLHEGSLTTECLQLIMIECRQILTKAKDTQ